VTVVVDQATAHLPATQHAAWLLVTLLTRCQTPVVERIVLACPPGVLLAHHVDPHVEQPGVVPLRDALLATESLAGPDASPVVGLVVGDAFPEPSNGGPVWTFVVTCAAQPLDRTSVGETHLPVGDAWEVSADGWIGRFAPLNSYGAHGPVRGGAGAAGLLPFGAYAAACLAVAAVYLSVRGLNPQPRPLTIDTWNLRIDSAEAPARPTALADGPVGFNVELDHVLAGVGAVGTALLQALWASPGVTGTLGAVDADSEGVDETNLHRCVLFTSADVGAPKAPLVADRLNRAGRFTLEGRRDRAERYVGPTTHLISAVDTATARQSLADKYPASVIQASTLDLRVEMLRCDPTQPTACLRCYNDPAGDTNQLPPDVDLRRRLADAGKDALTEHAHALGVPVEVIATWADLGGCGVLGDRMLDRLRPATGHRSEFSVGFVSVLAGVLLAAQVIKDSLGRSSQMLSVASELTDALLPPLRAAQARFTLSMLDSVSTLPPARAYARDPACPACQPGPRMDVWRSRWTG
jgi:molybdopterin/thiamine biosynthesis adenylyltransferase